MHTPTNQWICSINPAHIFYHTHKKAHLFLLTDTYDNIETSLPPLLTMMCTYLLYIDKKPTCIANVLDADLFPRNIQTLLMLCALYSFTVYVTDHFVRQSNHTHCT